MNNQPDAYSNTLPSPKYDVIVIGGGAAGMSSAIFTTRKKLKTLIVTIDMGGQNLLTEHEENYPGYLEASGPKLMRMFEQQARSFGAEFIFGKAKRVEKNGNNFHVTLASGERYECRVLILAFGKVPRSLGIPGEEELAGRGISTCAALDIKDHRGKSIVVIGGGNSAVEKALAIAQEAKKVYLVHRRDAFRADEVTVEKLRTSRIELVLNSVPAEVGGRGRLESVVVENVNTKERRNLAADHMLIEIGYMVDTSFVKHLVNTNHENEILVNDAGETNCTGIFAAGDVTNVPYKQTAISSGMGATAGLSAYNYLMKLEGRPGVKVDWG